MSFLQFWDVRDSEIQQHLGIRLALKKGKEVIYVLL